MEKEKLSNDLRGLVGENSLSDRTWNDYVENSVMPFLPSEEDKHSEYLMKHANALKSLNGQLSHDVAAKVNEAKKAIVPPQQSLEQPKLEQPSNNSQQDDSIALLKRIEKLEAERERELQEAARKTLLSNAERQLKSQGADNEYILEIAIGMTPISVDANETDLIKSIKAKYDETYSKLYGEGIRPALGGNHSVKPNGKISTEAQKVKDKMIAERKQLRV